MNLDYIFRVCLVHTQTKPPLLCSTYPIDVLSLCSLSSLLETILHSSSCDVTSCVMSLRTMIDAFSFRLSPDPVFSANCCLFFNSLAATYIISNMKFATPTMWAGWWQ